MSSHSLTKRGERTSDRRQRDRPERDGRRHDDRGRQLAVHREPGSQLLWCTLGGALGRVLTRPWQWRTLDVALAVLLVASVVPLWVEAS